MIKAHHINALLQIFLPKDRYQKNELMYCHWGATNKKSICYLFYGYVKISPLRKPKKVRKLGEKIQFLNPKSIVPKYPSPLLVSAAAI